MKAAEILEVQKKIASEISKNGSPAELTLVGVWEVALQMAALKELLQKKFGL